MKWFVLVLIAVIAFSFGCAKPYTLGVPIERAKVDQIVPGTTPELKVIEIFGPPEKKEATKGGGIKYVYNSFKDDPRVWSKSIQRKSILELYIREGIVQGYELKSESINLADK